jgi:hypothetical protein
LTGLNLETRMTPEQWQASTDPAAMIAWLSSDDRFGGLLNGFVYACLDQVAADLDSDDFRHLLRQSRTGEELEDVLHDAARRVDILKKKIAKVSDDARFDRINRKIGMWETLLCLGLKALPARAADISKRLLDWSPKPAEERRRQADLLRALEADKDQYPDLEDEDGDE